MVEQHKNFCPACGHMMAKPKRGLSTIEFRRTVHKCEDRNDLHENICKLIKIYRTVTKDAGLTVTFSQGFEGLLNEDQQDINNIKLWLFEQLNRLDRDVGERALYRLLYDFYSEEGIDTPFSVFYENYVHYSGPDPLSKNCVSRALSALGLKTKMVQMNVDDKKKSVISIQASASELRDIFKKNGISY